MKKKACRGRGKRGQIRGDLATHEFRLGIWRMLLIPTMRETGGRWHLDTQHPVPPISLPPSSSVHPTFSFLLSIPETNSPPALHLSCWHGRFLQTAHWQCRSQFMAGRQFEAASLTLVNLPVPHPPAKWRDPSWSRQERGCVQPRTHQAAEGELRHSKRQDRNHHGTVAKKNK